LRREKAVAERLRGTDVKLLDRVVEVLKLRSLRYYQATGLQGTKQPFDDYEDAAIWIMQKARELSTKPCPHGNHSLKTWLCILVGPELEKAVLEKDGTFGNKIRWDDA
jgi:hypothetical protein